MARLRLLDLFCGAGGAAAGYRQAGLHVTGIDLHPQAHYAGNRFLQTDALTYLARHGQDYDFVHASPPCQHYANVTRWRGDQTRHPDLLPVTLALLARMETPWIVENVPGAPLRCDVQLCGSQFGLRVQRHRWFQCSLPVFALLPPCHHRHLLPFMHKGERQYTRAMGCHWMTNIEAREAIPPAYTNWLGALLLTTRGTETRP